MAVVGDAPREDVGKSASEDDSFSTAGHSPPSSNLLREIAKGTEHPCCTQAEVLETDMPCHAVGQGKFNANGRISLMIKL